MNLLKHKFFTSLNFSSDSKKLTMVLSGLFIIFFLTQNYIFIKWDKEPLHTDDHIIHAISYYENLAEGYYNSLEKIQFPPLIYVTAVPVFLLRGISMESARLSMLLFAFIFLLSMYGIGRELGGYCAGFITLAIAASSPPVISLSRQFLPDFPQTAVAALSIYLLIKCSCFKNRFYSMLLGMALALSFLTKWSSAFFMFFLIAGVFLSLLPEALKKPGRFLVLAGYLAAVISAGAYYFINLDVSRHFDNSQWFQVYFLVVVLPSLLWFTAVFFMERKEHKQLVKKEQEGDVNTCRINNFGLFALCFFTIGSTWYLWAAGTVKEKLFFEIDNYRVLADNLSTIINYLLFGLTFFPVYLLFIIIGIGFLIIKFKDYFSRSILYFLIPLNIIFVCILLWKISFVHYRYYLTLVVFLAALAGFWIDDAKKAKIPLCITIFILSVLSLSGWFISNNNVLGVLNYKEVNFFRNYKNIKKAGDLPLFTLPKTRSPNFAVIDTKSPALEIAENSLKDPIDILVFAYPDFRVGIVEQAAVDIKNLGRRVLTNSIPYDKERYSNPGALFRPNGITPMLLSRIKKAQDPVSQKLLEHLNPQTISLLHQWEENQMPSLELHADMAEDLNLLLKTEEPIHIALGIHINPHERRIQELFKENPAGKEMVFLNRMIMDEEFKRELPRRFDPIPLKRFDTLQYIIILHTSLQDPQDAVDEIKAIYIFDHIQNKTFPLGEDFIITLIPIAPQQQH